MIGPQGVELIIANISPSFILVGILTNTLLMIINTIIIIGALLSYLSHSSGNKLVKYVSLIAIFLIVLLTILSLITITNSKNYTIIAFALMNMV